MTDILPRQDWTDADAYTPVPLWLTRIELTRSAQGLSERDIHLALEWAHPGDGRILWVQPARHLLVVQSPVEIDMSRLVGVAANSAARERRFDYKQGQAVTLSGILNPVLKGGTLNGVRQPRRAAPPDRYTEWLTARLTGVIDVREVRAEPLRPLRVRKPDRTVTAARAGYEATGIVTHPRRLAWLCDKGLGAQKAYGCGLLLAVGS